MALPALYRPTHTTLAADTYITLDGWAATNNPGDAADTTLTEWWLTSLDGWHNTPDLRLSGVDRPQDHGQFDGPTYWTSRVITATGTAIAPDKPTAYTARDIITSLCWDPAVLWTLQVTEPGPGTRRAYVRLNTATKTSDVNDVAFDWQIQFKAPDPRKYADIEPSSPVTLSPPTGAVGGVPYPTTVPFSFTTVGLATSTASITNAGTAPTRPTVTLNGPLADPQIANVTVGRSLAFTGLNIAAGDNVVIDFDRRTALYNGSASRNNYLAASSAWWELAPGGNNITIAAGGGSGTAVIAWRSAWW